MISSYKELSMKDIIEYQDFAKIELRVGQVVAAQAPEWSDKLIEMSVDFGQELGQRTILAGAKEHYQPDEFVNKKYLFVVNLAERKMGQSVSQGMMLMVDQDDQPIKFELPDSVELGAVVR
ncbi:MAG: methionine--tRNA ligase [Candidatus Pacebacteria bacterium]|nr:methionine--tRNA ligase [Candidatus Paceibacterota bacterium]